MKKNIDVKNKKKAIILTFEKAKALALETAGGGKVIKCRLAKDKMDFKYDIIITKDTACYKLKIDSQTGELIAFAKKAVKANDKKILSAVSG